MAFRAGSHGRGSQPRAGCGVRLLPLVRAALVGYLLTVLGAMIFEETLIFPAPRYPEGNWHPRGSALEEAEFTAADGTRLHGWYFPRDGAEGQLLYFHGNADFVPNLAPLASLLRRRCRVGVLIFDYRGYGRSEGRPHEKGILLDARAAHQWLCQRTGVAEDRVILMGRSLGGAVAVDLAAEKGARGLVLENTFTSLPDVAHYHFPWLPTRLCMRTRLNARAKIVQYRGPLLQSHGTADEVVPYPMGRALYEAAPGDKQFLTFEGLEHNDPHPAAYYETLRQFVLDTARSGEDG